MAGANLHAVGELIDDDITALLAFRSGKDYVVSVKQDHHLPGVFLGLSGVDKEQVSSDDTLQIQREVAALQLAQGNGVVHLVEQIVHHFEGILGARRYERILE